MRGLRGARHHALEIRLGSPKAAEFLSPVPGRNKVKKGLFGVNQSTRVSYGSLTASKRHASGERERDCLPSTLPEVKKQFSRFVVIFFFLPFSLLLIADISHQ